MRTLIDLEDKAVAALDRLAREENVSRSALIREAVADLLQRREKPRMEAAFGLWAGSDPEVDGVAYQRSLREEW
ncbi:CopG family transcriptional regulator [Rhizobium sp. CSW-27]|uniref:ribbon-helix-helix domain-containing protein n=1 Tax=Rhizobium sp. CSW-27 TaxID=2839985 RepID=UPI001C03464B|nr:CopG family transcriptional regulator [Rhizobium sp. CSW-27]MBT9368727.1 ribbon-helix-helix domain-containing protein [Rhizobium sp. CSW-27]